MGKAKYLQLLWIRPLGLRQKHQFQRAHQSGILILAHPKDNLRLLAANTFDAPSRSSTLLQAVLGAARLVAEGIIRFQDYAQEYPDIPKPGLAGGN